MNHLLRRSLLMLLLLLAAAAVGAQEKKEGGPYRLQAGDEISLEVSPQKTYSSAGIILPDGFVFLRKVGKLRAAGRSLDELTADIRKVLEQDLNEPEVLVTLTKMAPPPPPPMTEPVKIGRV